MKSPGKLITTSIVLVSLFSQNAYAATIKPGASCAKLNQKASVSNVSYICIKSGTKKVWKKSVLQVKPVASNPTPTPVPVVTPDAAVLPADYPGLAAAAKNSILTSNPVGTTSPTLVFDAEPTVPQINVTRMKEEAAATFKVYASAIPDVKVVHFLFYSSDSWGLDHALLVPSATNYSDYNFKADMVASFTGRFEPKMPCRDLGGFSVDALKEPLIIIQGAACDWYDSREVAQGIDYSSSVIAHEITHLIQQRAAGVSNAACVLPSWLREGQPQVAGMDLSVTDGVDTTANSRGGVFFAMVRPSSIEAFTSLETDSPGPEYRVGAALSEYLIGRSGWKKLISLTSKVNGGSNACPSKDQMMKNFTTVFQNVYGQSLISFYNEALPYVQYVYDHQVHTVV